MKDMTKMAWKMLCKDCAGDAHQFDFWREVPLDVQETYVTKAVRIVCDIEQRMLNGNWTTAIELFVATPGMRLDFLDKDYYRGDIVILGDYVIEELRNAKF